MFFKIYQYINILSIDVVAGACVCSMFIAEILGVQLRWDTVSLLGICVWVIYTFDHLNDAKNIPHEAGTKRHRFHQIHFKKLVLGCIAGVVAASFFVFRIPAETVVWGTGLSCFVIGYFLLLYFLKSKSSYHKEIMIAILYASGIMVGPLSIYEGLPDGTIIILFFQFVLLAFTNLLTFAVYELHTDERDSAPSLVRAIGHHLAAVFLKVLIAIQVLAAACLSFQSSFFEFEIIFMLMIVLLGSVFLLRQHFVGKEMYRFIGDAVFLVPALGLYFYY